MSGMCAIKAIIFDMTDTILEFDFRRMREEFGKIIKGHECTRHLAIGQFMDAYKEAYDSYQRGEIQNDNAFWEKMFGLLKVNPKKGEFRGIMRRHLASRRKFVKLHRHAGHIFGRLKKKYRLAILSNAVRNWADYDWKFLKFNPKKYFDVQLYSQDTRLLKPERKAFELALRKLNVSAKEALMVGDNESQDILGGNSAGLVTVFLANKYRLSGAVKPRFVVNSLEEIEKIAGEM
ncbi:MAG: HAD family hydrolase [Candidatus Diapherotrites archaeon]|nr:HAD family hydrolase [Candidatus Diapherotrites archaeon]